MRIISLTTRATLIQLALARFLKHKIVLRPMHQQPSRPGKHDDLKPSFGVAYVDVLPAGQHARGFVGIVRGFRDILNRRAGDRGIAALFQHLAAHQNAARQFHIDFARPVAALPGNRLHLPHQVRRAIRRIGRDAETNARIRADFVLAFVVGFPGDRYHRPKVLLACPNREPRFSAPARRCPRIGPCR